MKISKHIKFSKEEKSCAASILLVFLIGPLLIQGSLIFIYDFVWSWKSVVMFIALMLITSLLYYGAIRPYIKRTNRLSLSGFGLGAIYFSIIVLFWGTFLLVTGMTPTKHNSVPIPRIYSLNYYKWAFLFVSIGIICVLTGKKIVKTPN
jgi:hypothetical protein